MEDTHISRRTLLGTVGAAGALGLAGCTGGGDGSDGTTTTADTTTSGTTADETTTTTTTTSSSPSGKVKIGVLQPLSGDLKYYGQQSMWGFYSGLAYKGDTDPIAEARTGTQTMTIGDVEYELVVRDTQLKAETAQQLATDFAKDDEVDVLFGCTSSASADRVIKTVSKQTGIPTMIGPAASASITSTSETCAENVFRANENTAMDARSGGQYVADETDVSKVYLFGADYSFGHAVVANYKAVLQANDIEIVGEKFVPRGYSEWKGLLDNAADAGAEGIVGGFTVATLPALFTTFLSGGYDFRVFGGFATRITNAIVGQTLQKVLGKPLTAEKIADAKLGPFTTRYHWNQYDNEINDAYVDMSIDTYGAVPDLLSGGTFVAASAIVQAVEESGSTEGADIAEALRGMTVRDTPKGEGGYVFQEYNNQARSAMTVANPVPTTEEWADTWGAAVMPGEPMATISKDQTTIPSDGDQMDCSL